MPEGVRWTRPGGGPTLWLELPASVRAADVEAYLAPRGVAVSSTSAAFVGAPHLQGIRIAYAYLSEDDMRRALTLLAQAISEVRR
jgi:2-aminoadipate transaminase